MKEIEKELRAPFSGQPVKLDPGALTAVAGRNGFTLAGTERCVYEGMQDELIELMTIPAMIKPLTSGLSGGQRQAVEVGIPWVYFSFVRDDPE